MKSEKGITLLSLVLYVVAVTIIVGTVATITSFFYSNTENINEASKAIGEYNKFNLEMLREVKEEGNRVVSITENGTRIAFSSGNTYTLLDGGLYKNKIKICTGVINCSFRKDMQEEKEIVTAIFEMKDFAKTVQYVIDNSKIGTSTNIEESYTQVSSEQYVQDGLQLHYDALNNTGNGHSDTTDTWRDLSPNHNDGVIEFGNGMWETNSLVLDGSRTGVFVDDNLVDLFKEDNTIQILLEIDEEGTRDIFVGNYNTEHAINYEKYGDGNLFRHYIDAGGNDIRTCSDTMKIGEIQILTWKWNKGQNTIEIYQDNRQITNFTANRIGAYSYDWNNAWFGRDSRTGETCLKGKIFSIRVYNKLLSQEEINQNYQVDVIRYGIEVPQQDME